MSSSILGENIKPHSSRWSNCRTELSNTWIGVPGFSKATVTFWTLVSSSLSRRSRTKTIPPCCSLRISWTTTGGNRRVSRRTSSHSCTSSALSMATGEYGRGYGSKLRTGFRFLPPQVIKVGKKLPLCEKWFVTPVYSRFQERLEEKSLRTILMPQKPDFWKRLCFILLYVPHDFPIDNPGDGSTTWINTLCSTGHYWYIRWGRVQIDH